MNNTKTTLSSIALENNKISRPKKHNALYFALQSDLDEIFAQAYNAEDIVLEMIEEVNNQFVDSMRKTVGDLNKRLEQYKLIALNKDYAAITSLDLSINHANAELIDPKTKTGFSINEIAPVDGNYVYHSGIVEAKYTDATYYTSIKTELGATQSVISTGESLNYFFVRTAPDALKVHLVIEMPATRSVNTLFFDSFSEYPFAIKSLRYQDNTDQFQVIESAPREKINGSFFINFPTIETKKFIVEFELKKCRATNRFLGYNSEIQNLSESYFEFEESFIGSDFKYFVFHLGFTEVAVGKLNHNDRSVFVSETFYASNLKSLELSTKEVVSGSDVYTEYYVEIAGTGIPRQLVPINPINKTGTVKEFAKPILASLIDSIYSGNVYGTQLNFYPESITGTNPSEAVTQDGDVLLYDTFQADADYTVEYVPKFANVNYPIKLSDPESIDAFAAMSFEFSDGIYDEIEKKLRFILPYQLDSVSVERRLVLPESESLTVISDISVDGRVVTINNVDVSENPIHYDYIYNISGNHKYTNFDNQNALYRSPRGGIAINPYHMNNNEVAFRIVAITRSVNNSNSSSLINSIYLFSNTSLKSEYDLENNSN